MSLSYEERQKKWIEEHDVEVGDFVMVMQKYDSKTCGNWIGWYYWAPEMDKFVGRVCKVVKICEDAITLTLDGGCGPYYFPYSVLRKEKEVKKSYIERQDDWVKKNDIKIGDKVRLIRKAESVEDGWPNVWSDKVDGWVGKILKVKEISGGSISCYDFETNDWFNFPYFVLEKVVEPKDKDKEWTVSYGLKVKTGDPVLMRDDVTSTWWYSIFSHKHSGEGAPFPYCSAGTISMFCIPYKGNEHLVGTTDDYKAPEEPTKPKFVFGAKVKATLSSGEEKEGVLIGIDTEDHYTPFEVAVQDKDGEFGRIRYWAESVNYID